MFESSWVKNIRGKEASFAAVTLQSQNLDFAVVPESLQVQCYVNATNTY